MPIRLVSETERNVASIDGATFFYRRVPFTVRQRLTRQHTERGLLNNDTYALALLEYALLDWEGIVDQQGKTVPFSLAILPHLPEQIMASLLGRISDATAEQDLGNSNGHVSLT
jgi:hypothetical protein